MFPLQAEEVAAQIRHDGRAVGSDTAASVAPTAAVATLTEEQALTTQRDDLARRLKAALNQVEKLIESEKRNQETIRVLSTMLKDRNVQLPADIAELGMMDTKPLNT